MEYVVKFFEAGDHVRVSDGKYKGESGIVVLLEGQFASVALSKNLREVRIFANSLKLKTEIDQTMAPESGLIDKRKFGQFSANDLIVYNTKYVGVVLKVEDDYLKVINNEGEL
jgi:transcription elongation factor SPT5